MAALTITLAGLVATTLLLGASAFFSSAETAVFSLSPTWIDRHAGTADHRAQALQALYADPHRLLVTLLVGNNVVNVAIATILAVLVARVLPPGPTVVATTILSSVVILIAGEIVPKAFGLANAESWSLRVAVPVTRIAWVLAPLISAFDAITRRLNAVIATNTAIERPYLE